MKTDLSFDSTTLISKQLDLISPEKEVELKLSSALFIPLQEENLIPNIIFLGQELKHEQDLPKAIIAFQQQNSNLIRFTVIMLRFVNSNIESDSLQQLSRKLPRTVHFIPERAAKIGSLDHFVKEVHVFTLEIGNHKFVRDNHSVDLVKARQAVSDALEQMIGPYFDYTDRALCQIQPNSSCKKNKHTALPPSSFSKPFSNLESGADASLLSKQKGAPQKQILHLHLPRAAQSLDPRIGNDRTSGIVINMLYEGLFRLNQKKEVEPAVVERVEISKDQKKYRFFLKKTTWSNGLPLTAYDFAYAWKKNLEPDLYSLYAFLLFPIKNAEAVKRGEKAMQEVGIHVLDALTLSVELERPTPHFLNLTANWIFFPLSQEMDQKHPGWAYLNDQSHICNGPFKLDQWDLNDNLKLVKNPLYWDYQNVKLEEIEISILSDEKEALELFYHGKLDWIGDPLSKIPPLAIPNLQKNKILQVDDNHGIFWLQLNLSVPHFQNSLLRRAFAVGTQRKPLIADVLKSQDIPAYGLSDYHHPITPFYEDKEQAKTFFNLGLEATGLQLKDLPTLVISHSEIEEQEALAHALGKQWQTLFGIEVTYKKRLWNDFFNSLHQDDFMVGGLVWYDRSDDPLYKYNLLIHKEYVVQVTRWKNTAYQETLQKAEQSQSLKERGKWLKECEKILFDEMPVIPLFYQKFQYIKNPKLNGYNLTHISQIDFRTAYFDRS